MKGEVQLEKIGGEDPADSDPLLENPPHHSISSSSSSSTEIEVEEGDIESASIPCCRICLESDAELGLSPFF